MKKIAFHNVYEELNKDNFLFIETNTFLGDDLLYPFHKLKEVAEHQNILCGTTDFFHDEKIDAFVFIDFPQKKGLVEKVFRKNQNLYLILFENEVVMPKNWIFDNHKYFKKIFTWNDDLVDNEKYFKLNYPQPLPQTMINVGFKDKKLCTLIASNKLESANGELYSKRIEAIRWFEHNAPDRFDLYGYGWDENRFSGVFKILNLLNKLPLPFQGLRRHKRSTWH